ncbi:MAG TPA: AsmA family protein, partial [Flavobacteriales bacterium]|nr:AsmA family protein [Flavobacteriales bacterium]
MLKKIAKILGVVIVLLLAAVILLPVIFKDKIIETVKEEINNNVEAKVDFGEFDLSLISSFPDFTFSIEAVKVEGIGEFEGVKLANIGELNLVVDLMSVINGDFIKIKVVEIISPEMNVIVTRDGKANYDIAKASDTTEVEPEIEVEEPEAESAAFKMELERFEISNANITYDDRQGNMYAGIEELNFVLGGDFSSEITDIDAALDISAITYKMDGVSFLNKAEIEIDVELAADLTNSKYTFTENNFRINQLVLGLDGWVQMSENDAMDMDVKFNTKQTSFKSILSLVPAVYSRDFEAVETNGLLALSGFAKGHMEGETYPAFGLDLSVKDANFKYPDLPKSVDNIQIAVGVASPGGDLNNTVVDVSTFHFELASNPFDMGVLIKTPMTDPYLKAFFKGQIDLNSLKDVIPLEEGDEINGLIAMDISMEGNQSTIDEERYEDFEASGNLVITEMDYASKELPYKVKIAKIDVDFAPKYITLKEMD